MVGVLSQGNYGLLEYDYDSEFFTIELHHGGEFRNCPVTVYVGGKVAYFDYCDPDQMSLLELVDCCEKVGVIEVYVKHNEPMDSQATSTSTVLPINVQSSGRILESENTMDEDNDGFVTSKDSVEVREEDGKIVDSDYPVSDDEVMKLRTIEEGLEARLLVVWAAGNWNSTLVVAMANYLGFDVYDLELIAVRSDSDLRRLLIRTANLSIIMVEDIDCSLSLDSVLLQSRIWE
ncbi:hypothetical protein RJ639_031569 [Escallonia herrerae]|uniref:PB1-like domain-containing protein n=1 Tax=Escallonia herrerae TaxID=1293975 RepID=A0AA89BIN9_9ASTE|nr:hypothetical protein RJ639_031569 [Escallonia herrerae]